MDSIMRDDDGKDEKREDDQFKTRELKIEENIEEEVVVIRRGKASEKEIEAKRKRRLAELMPDEVFKAPKVGKRRLGCLNCFVMTTITMLIFLLIILVWGNKILYQDLFMKSTIPLPVVNLNENQKKDLDLKLSKYQEALDSSLGDKAGAEFEIELTGSQLNYLVQEMEKKNADKRKTYFRLYPNDNSARLEVSIPYKKNRFLNYYAEGIPTVEHYKLNMKLFSLRMGNVRKATWLKDRYLKMMNRHIDIYLQYYKIPYRIKSAKIEENKIKAVLILHPAKTPEKKRADTPGKSSGKEEVK